MINDVGEQSEVEFDEPLENENEELELSDPQRKIYTDKGDPEIESLYGKYNRGKLIIQPEFQRQFVWDAGKSSRLIESALLDIPLPVVYLSEEPNGRESVIDGQQRLTSFFSFIGGKFPTTDRDFKLTGLKVFHHELNGKTFKDLSDEQQDKIRYCKIPTITFKKESDSTLKFEVFERLNTGSVSLNDQELRNCIYRGKYNDLLKDLSCSPKFRELLCINGPDKRMRDVELVLRFTAFYRQTYLNYKPPMCTFLNREMENNRSITDQDADQLRSAFKNTVDINMSLLGSHAFKRFYKGTESNRNGRWELKRFNASLYDVLMYCFAKADKNAVYQHLDSVKEALLDLMTSDQEFIDSIELSTSSVQAVTKRFDKWRHRLESIIGIQQREPRCFSLQLKQELYESDATCKLCGQHIHDLDDAAVDHVEQYWTGGRTIPDNARLTHRYCNTARSRND